MNPFMSGRGAGQGSREQTGDGDPFGKMSVIFAVLSVLSLVYFYVTIPVSLVAICFGVLGLRSQYRTRSIVAIVIGVILFLTGAVLMISWGAMFPYAEELMTDIYGSLG